MNVQVEAISPVKKKINVEISAERVSSEIAATYKKIAKNAKIKGFRKGKVPMSVVEKYFAGDMEQDVVNRLIQETYYQALVDHDIAAIAHPTIEQSGELHKDQPFTYEAHVEVKPEVEVRDYKGLSLQKEAFVFDGQLVETRIEQMLESRAQQEVVVRDEAQQGDFVTIDFEGFVDGVAFEHGAATDHVLELGSGSFIDGFEDQLVGMKRGEEKEIAVTFPQEYGNKELAGKDATFKVALKEIKVKVLPQLDDELAGEFGAESAEQLRQQLTDNLQQQEQKRIEEDLKERLMAALIERNPLEVPDTMIERQLDFMHENLSRRLKAQGLNMEMMGMNAQSFRAMYRNTATRQVQGSLLLEAVGRQESIAVDEAEVDQRLVEIAEMAQAPLEEVKKYYAGEEARKGLLAQIEEEKVMRFLLDQASIEEVAAEVLKGTAGAAEQE